MSSVAPLRIKNTPMAKYISEARYIKRQYGQVSWSIYLKKQVPEQLRKQVEDNS